MIATGEIVGLAEEIIDDTGLVITLIFDPPGPSRISGHYFHTECPYVRIFVAKKTNYNKTRYTLHVTWGLVGHFEVS